MKDHGPLPWLKGSHWGRQTWALPRTAQETRLGCHHLALSRTGPAGRVPPAPISLRGGLRLPVITWGLQVSLS